MDERLSEEARELIDQYLREEVPADPVELARIRGRVLVISVGVSAGALGSAGKAMAVSGVSATLAGVSIMKAALLGATAAMVAIGLSSALEADLPRAAAPTSSEASATSSAVPAKQANEIEGPPRPLAMPVAPPTFASAAPAQNARRSASEPKRAVLGSSSAVPSDAPPSAVPASALFEEVALLERVQSALRSGDGVRALDLLDQVALAPEAGQLGAERLAAEIFAACQTGDRERALRAARRFFRDYSSTPASARVRASCAGEVLGQ
jgi:hypothetical protein